MSTDSQAALRRHLIQDPVTNGSRRPKLRAWFACAVTFILLGAAGHALGWRLSLLYLLPVAISSWTLGRATGVVTSLRDAPVGRSVERAANNYVDPFGLVFQALGPGDSSSTVSRRRWRTRLCPFDRLLAHVPVQASALDIGCGDGLLLGLLAARGHRIQGLGLERSARRVAQANAMAGRLSGEAGDSSLRFVEADITEGWTAGQYDVVSLIDVIHHLPPEHQERVFERAGAAVRPGGRLLYKDMCLRPHWRSWANRLHDLVLSREWIHYLPVDKAEQLANRCGLDLIAAERINRYWYGHELRVFVKRVES